MSIQKSPFAIPNVRRFILFRMAFNSRLYYPVFTILFLDFGLSLTQFAMLNVLWAATIVVLEVPSGALADTIGRKNLVVLSACMMVLELLLISFVPLGNSTIIFAAFFLNRILSGIAEAAASGADEALAYDSLAQEGNKEDWGKVLEWQMRLQAISFLIALSIGSAVYDPKVMQQLADWFGLHIVVTQEMTLRLPLYGTLILSLITLYTALRMEEPFIQKTQNTQKHGTFMEAVRLTLATGKWILHTPMPLAIIMFGMLFDHSVRLILTLNSQYYRVIQLPEATFGLIGAFLALLGFIIPKGARWLAENQTPVWNTALLGGILAISFWGLSLTVPYAGILPMIFLSSCHKAGTFLVSHYLNAETSSEQRATVLSFRGLSNNFAYGLIGILYSLLLAYIRGDLTAQELSVNSVFTASLRWLPPYFLILFSVFWAFCWWQKAYKTKQ